MIDKLKYFMILLIGLLTCSKNWAQSYETTTIPDSLITFSFQFPNPIKQIQAFENSLNSQYDSFSHPSIPTIMLNKSTWMPSINLSIAYKDLVRTTKYLRKDSNTWSSFKVLSKKRFSYTYSSTDTLIFNCSPGLDTLIIGTIKNSYLLKYIIDQESYTASAYSKRFSINYKEGLVNNKRISKSEVVSEKGKRVYTNINNSNITFLNDSNVFQIEHSDLDSFKINPQTRTDYFKDFEISQSAEPFIFDYSGFQKVKLKDGGIYFIYSSKFDDSEGNDLIETYLTHGRSRKGLINEFSFQSKAVEINKNEVFDNHGPWYILTKKTNSSLKVLDFALRFETDKYFDNEVYYTVMQNDILDRYNNYLRILLKKDFLNDRLSYTYDRFTIDTNYFNFDLINISRFRDQSGPYYERYSEPLDWQDTWVHKDFYVGYLQKVDLERIKSLNSLVWIDLSKSQNEQHSHFLKGNYIVFEKVDTGFRVFDARYKNRVMDNDFNRFYYVEVYTEPISARSLNKSRKRDIRVEERNYKKEQNQFKSEFKYFRFNGIEILCKKVEMKNQKVWLFANERIQFPLNSYPYDRIDTIVFSLKRIKELDTWGRFKKNKKHQITGIKYNILPWIVTSDLKIEGSKSVERIDIFYHGFYVQGRGIHYALDLSKIKGTADHILFTGAYFYVSSLDTVDKQPTSLDIYLPNNSFKFRMKGVPSLYRNHGSNVPPFSYSSSSILYEGDSLFSGAIVYSRIPRQAMFENTRRRILHNILLDSSAIKSLNPQLRNTIESINLKHNISFIISEFKSLPVFKSLNPIPMWSYKCTEFFEVFLFSNGILDSIFSYNYRGDLINARKAYEIIDISSITDLKVVISIKSNCVTPKTTNEFIDACYNTSAPLDSLIPFCEQYPTEQYGYQKIDENSIPKFYRYQKLMGPTTKEFYPIYTYVFDTLTQVSRIITYRYKNLKLEDSFVLVKQNREVTGRIWAISHFSDQLIALANIKTYSSQRHNIPKKQRLLFSMENNQLITIAFNEQGDTIRKNIYPKDSVNLLKVFSEFEQRNKLGQAPAYSNGVWSNSFKLVSYHQNKPVLETLKYGNWNELLRHAYYQNESTYLDWVKTDTCKNCQNGFTFGKNGKKVAAKFDLFHHFYRIYYTNGKLMGTAKQSRYQREWTLNYNCNDSTKFFTFPFEFIEFYDSSGRQTFNGDTGRVLLLGSHNLPVYEASYNNGLRNGFYKGYSETGKLNEVGNYVNGKKNGTWYTGDLDGELDWGLICSSKYNPINRYFQPSDGLATVRILEFANGNLISQMQVRFKK